MPAGSAFNPTRSILPVLSRRTTIAMVQNVPWWNFISEYRQVEASTSNHCIMIKDHSDLFKGVKI